MWIQVRRIRVFLDLPDPGLDPSIINGNSNSGRCEWQQQQLPSPWQLRTARRKEWEKTATSPHECVINQSKNPSLVQCCGSGSACIRIKLKGRIRSKVIKQDPDPHQRYNLNPDPHQFADDNPKCMEYEPIWALFQGFELLFVSKYPDPYPHQSNADPHHCPTSKMINYLPFLSLCLLPLWFNIRLQFF